jgi:hypothetical protein
MHTFSFHSCTVSVCLFDYDLWPLEGWMSGTLYLPIYAVVNLCPVWSIFLRPFDTLVHLDLEAGQ